MTMLSTTRRVSGGLLATLAFAVAAAAQTAFAPAVIVNDDIITYYDVGQRAKLLQLSGAQPGPQLNSAAVEQLIDDRLRAQAGRRAGLSADPEELSAAIEEFAQRFNLDGAGFLAKTRSAGIDRQALDSFLGSQVVWRELVNARFGARATPSEVELDQEIALAAASQTKSYRISEIAIPAGPGQEAEARAALERIMRELRRGADFATLARRYSRAPSAANGGDVGWVPDSMLPRSGADNGEHAAGRRHAARRGAGRRVDLSRWRHPRRGPALGARERSHASPNRGAARRLRPRRDGRGDGHGRGPEGAGQRLRLASRTRRPGDGGID